MSPLLRVLLLGVALSACSSQGEQIADFAPSELGTGPASTSDESERRETSTSADPTGASSSTTTSPGGTTARPTTTSTTEPAVETTLRGPVAPSQVPVPSTSIAVQAAPSETTDATVQVAVPNTQATTPATAASPPPIATTAPATTTPATTAPTTAEPETTTATVPGTTTTTIFVGYIFGRPYLSDGYWLLPDAYSVDFTGIQWRRQGSDDPWQEPSSVPRWIRDGNHALVPDVWGYNVDFRQFADRYSSDGLVIYAIWPRGPSSGY